MLHENEDRIMKTLGISSGGFSSWQIFAPFVRVKKPGSLLRDFRLLRTHLLVIIVLLAGQASCNQTSTTPSPFTVSTTATQISVYYFVDITVDVTGESKNESEIIAWLDRVFRTKLEICVSPNFEETTATPTSPQTTPPGTLSESTVVTAATTLNIYNTTTVAATTVLQSNSTAIAAISTTLEGNNTTVSKTASDGNSTTISATLTPSSVTTTGVTTELFQRMEVSCSIKTAIRNTQCSVMLRLNQTVSPCCILRALCAASNASSDFYVVGKKADRVGQLQNECNNSSKEENSCIYSGQDSASCNESAAAYVASQSNSTVCGADINNYSCNCSAYCNGFDAYYTFGISVQDPNINILHVFSLIAKLQQPPACSLSTNVSCPLSNVASQYMDANIACENPSTNLQKCRVILAFAQEVNNVADAVKYVFQSEEQIRYDGTVTQAAICGNFEVDENPLQSQLTWVSTDLKPENFCAAVQDSNSLTCQNGKNVVVQLQRQYVANVTSASPNTTTVQQNTTEAVNITTTTTSTANLSVTAILNTTRTTTDTNNTTAINTTTFTTSANNTTNNNTNTITTTANNTTNNNTNTITTTANNTTNNNTNTITTTANNTTNNNTNTITTTANNTTNNNTNTITTTANNTTNSSTTTINTPTITTANNTNNNSTITINAPTITTTATDSAKSTTTAINTPNVTPSESPTTTESAEGQARALLELTNDVSRLNSSQVNQLVSQLENLLSGPTVSTELGNISVNIVSNLLGASPEVLSDSSNRIIGIVDTVGLKLILKDTPETLLSPDVALSVKPADGTNFQETTFSISNPTSIQVRGNPRLRRSVKTDSSIPQGSIRLPSSLTQDLTAAEQQLVSRVQFNFYQKSTIFQDQSLGERKLNSGILGASVANLSITGLQDNVIITLKNTEPVPANFVATCVFWDFTLNNGSGGWNSNGCFVQNSTDNETICGCNHLTSFAILLDLSREPVISRIQATILTFITYIGCGISAIFLSVTLLTYLAFGKLRKDIPSKILIQLCLALLLLNLVFLVDAWLALYPEAVGLCISTAWFLHYFLLVAFTWMGLEAVHMYLALVKVFNTYVSHYMLKFSLAGWGIPMIVVIIVIAIDKDNYGLVSYARFTDGTTDDFCWLKNDIAFYVAVVAYFCVIFLFNLVMFIVVMVQLCRIKRNNPHNVQYRSTLQDVRSVLGITILLGLTWGFAFFAWGPVNLAFMYLFTIFNSLQGFFIFVFHCAVKESVRRQWRTYLCCGKMRLAENSEWSRTATQKTAKKSSLTNHTSLHSSKSSRGNNSSSSSSFLVSDSSEQFNGIGSPFEDRAITADEEPHMDVVLNEINMRHRNPQAS